MDHEKFEEYHESMEIFLWDLYIVRRFFRSIGLYRIFDRIQNNISAMEEKYYEILKDYDLTYSDYD